MRRTKKMLALLLAGVLTFSNVAYAAPGGGGSAPTEETVDNETGISNPEEEKEAANTPEEPTEAETLSEENAVPIDGAVESRGTGLLRGGERGRKRPVVIGQTLLAH